MSRQRRGVHGQAIQGAPRAGSGVLDGRTPAAGPEDLRKDLPLGELRGPCAREGGGEGAQRGQRGAGTGGLLSSLQKHRLRP